MDNARSLDPDMPFSAVVSLGPTCANKYQIGRHAFFKLLPDAPEDEYRELVWSDRPKPYGTYIFDWQITPTPALLKYFELDFRGLFEREDLEITDNGSEVVHRRFETRHPHSFHAPDGTALTPDVLDGQYAEARRKFDYLADKMRNRLRSAEPTLYVLREQPAESVISSLVAVLSANPDHPFRLLLVEGEGRQTDARYDDVRVLTAVVPETARRKDGSRQWEGDDEAWDAILGKFPLAAWSK